MANVYSVTFPGLSISRADFVLTHGVSPSACLVTCVPQQTSFGIGPLVLWCNGAQVATFPGCAIDHTFTTPPLVKRGQRSQLRILDRRWIWSTKHIDGRYNFRRPDSLPLEGTAADYYSMIAYCLETLGEYDYEIDLPYPLLEGRTVEWRSARADLELGRLVEEVGCIVTLGLDNKVRVVPDGVGLVYPPNGREREPLVDYLPSTIPYAIQTVFGPTRYQSKLELEAVGLDMDGLVVPIDDLTYKPEDGWDKQVPGIFNDVTPGYYRSLARDTVYKWYRIKGQSDGGLYLPGGTDSVTSIKDMLPLLPELILPEFYASQVWNPIDNWPPARPYVEGYFFNNDMAGWNECYIDEGENSRNFYCRWDDTFDLDLENGIVKFRQPMFDVIEKDGLYHQTPARLNLTCAYHARRSPSDPRYYRYSYITTNANADPNAGWAQVEREDLWECIVTAYEHMTNTQTGVSSNGSWLDQIGQEQCESYQHHWTNWPKSCMQWSGLIPVPLQGNIHQVRWMYGGGPALTYASRSCEIPTWGPTYYERRFREEAERHMPSLRR